MRGLRSFLVLLAILAALGAYVYFVESGRPAGDETREKAFAIEADGIEEIVLRAESGERTTLKRTGDRWEIVEPVSAAPDASEISALTTNLASLEVNRVVDEAPTDVAEYGLAEPRVEVAFRAGGEEHRLELGNRTPPGVDIYARTAASPRVFLISSYLDSTFNRGTFDLRDKAALKLEREKVETIEVAAAGRTLRFAKTGDDWVLQQPPGGRADYGAVEGLISRVANATIRSVAAENAGDLAPYGLDRPAASVRFGSGSSQAELLLGRAAPDEGLYAKDAARPAVVVVDASLLEEVTKAPGDYRQKDLFDARAFNTTRVEVTHGGQTLAFEKSGTGAEAAWRQVAPEEREADQAKIEALVSAATLARAETFVDGQPLDHPEITIALTSDGGRREERVGFARRNGEGLASRSGEPGLARLGPNTIDGIVAATEALKE